jgi:UDP-hydrolysing UDP-N-acetyl-D-glucosamine 2-epimerase
MIINKHGNVIENIKKDGFKIGYKIHNLVSDENLTYQAKTTGLAIIELSNYFINNKPDIVFVIADRFETIAASIASSYMNIPTIHLQGGELTGNIDNKVRNANTCLSDYHFVCTKKSKQKLIQMGESKDRIFNLGCPSIDLAKESLTIKFEKLKFFKYTGVGSKIKYQDFIVVLYHPVTNEIEKTRKNIRTLFEVINDLNMETIWLWPNHDLGTDLASKEIRSKREKNKTNNKIFYVKHFDSIDFLVLLRKAKMIIGNSSVGIRECSFLGTPAVNIGSRQNNRERGRNVIDCSPNKSDIKKAVKKHLQHGRYKCDYLYGDGESGRKIANQIIKFKGELKP